LGFDYSNSLALPVRELLKAAAIASPDEKAQAYIVIQTSRKSFADDEVLVRFSILLTPRLQPGEPQKMQNPSSRFNGFFRKLRKKTVETVLHIKNACNHRAEATVLMRFFEHQTASLPGHECLDTMLCGAIHSRDACFTRVTRPTERKR
jgi:hypothetical protein